MDVQVHQPRLGEVDELQANVELALKRRHVLPESEDLIGSRLGGCNVKKTAGPSLASEGLYPPPEVPNGAAGGGWRDRHNHRVDHKVPEVMGNGTGYRAGMC